MYKNDGMPKISDYFGQVEKDCIAEIKSIPDVAMLRIDGAVYVENHFNRYTLKPIQLDNLRDVRYEKVNDGGSLKARIYIPVVLGETIQTTLQYRSINTYFPQATLLYDANGYIYSVIEANKEAYERFGNDLKKEIELLNTDIERHSKELRNHLNYHFTVASNIIRSKYDAFDNFIKSIDIPIYVKENPQTIPVNIEVKEEIKPIATHGDRYTLSRSVFRSIMATINNCCSFMERVSATFAKMEEEDLRNVILTSLNSIFGCKALAEVFQKRGKTDIFIHFEGNTAFIAECKKWRGPKTIGDTLEQILGYLSWRETYGVIIIFSDNKNFSSVLDNTKAQIQAQKSYVSATLTVESDSHFIARHKLNDEDRKEIEVQYLIYNLNVKDLV